MPHKRNPILSERVAGLARVLRGYAGTALENQPLWHERDISHSSAERVILPDATILLDYLLQKVDGARPRPRRPAGADAREHRARARAPRVVARPAGAGRACRPLAGGRPTRSSSARRSRAADERRPLRELLALEPVVARSLSLADLDACFDDARHLRHVPEVIARLDALVRRARRRGRARERPRPMLAAESFVRSGKVRDLYDARRRAAAARRVGPDQRVRRRPADRDPRQGPRADRAVAVLVRRRRAAIVPNHLLGDRRRRACRDARRPGSASTSCAAGRWSAGARRCCRSRSSSAATSRAPAGRSTCARARSAASRCRRACARATGCPSRSSRPRRRPPVGEHDINIDFESMVELLADWAPDGDDWLGRDAARDLAERVRDVALRLYELGAARCADAGIILADTKFEMGLVDGELILVDEVLTPDSSRFWDAADVRAGRAAGELRQAVRPRLARAAAWDKTAPGPGAARRRRRRHARTLRRGVRADHRRELRALPRRGRDRTADDASLPVRRERRCRRPGSSTRRVARSRAASATSASRACPACASGGGSS